MVAIVAALTVLPPVVEGVPFVVMRLEVVILLVVDVVGGVSELKVGGCHLVEVATAVAALTVLMTRVVAVPHMVMRLEAVRLLVMDEAGGGERRLGGGERGMAPQV